MFFDGTKKPRSLTQYTLMQGVTDFGNLAQFNRYESGYSFLKIISVPKFIETLASENSDVKDLLDNYKHVLEYEFRGLDGLEDITTETSELTDGISQLSLINKTVMQSDSTVSMRYFEKSGSLLTKMHELIITGIKDPRTQVKTYHGLLRKGKIEEGLENEVFTFLYIVTDNTLLNVEKAYLLLAGQPTKAETNIYNSEKGTIEQKEVTAEFRCFPITGSKINKKAQLVLDYMNSDSNTNQIVTQYNDFDYTGISKINKDI